MSGKHPRRRKKKRRRAGARFPDGRTPSPAAAAPLLPRPLSEVRTRIQLLNKRQSMAKNPFHAHHAAAKKAHDAGDHAKAAKHIGHMFAANRAASKGAAAQPFVADSVGDTVTTGAGFDQSSSSPALPASTKSPFNRANFAALKGRNS